MLAPPNDFGYSPSHAQTMAQFDQQQHHHQSSAERPKIFGLDHHHPGMQGLGQHPMEFQQMINGSSQHAMTPHHHQPGDFDHEPLMLNMQHPNAAAFYPNMAQSMLHVSTDYGSGSSVGALTPSRRGNNSKRSREELNLKEKKRMFKLNDRINELKTILDDAGVQCKKNKQSILDNTHHYIAMLRSNLLIAKQKAERAEKQAEAFKNQAQKHTSGGSASGVDVMFRRLFEQSATPRLIVDTNLEVVRVNRAFLQHTGQSEESLQVQDTLRQSLCIDKMKLDEIVKGVVESSKPTSVVVQARAAHGVTTLTLTASSIFDEANGQVVQIDFTLIPFEMSSDLPQANFVDLLGKTEGEETVSPSGVTELTL